MRKGTKPQDKGTKYNLVYRSARDQAHAQEDAPSEVVMVPAISGNTARKMRNAKDRAGSARSTRGAKAADAVGQGDPFLAQLSTNKDHINALGLPNDGYDYSQHLRAMGQGKFIGKDGKEQRLPDTYLMPGPNPMAIPGELLASSKDLDRHLEAITLDERTMDADLLAALWGEGDEEGEFEELNDDFCVEAMQDAPVGEAFDWNAHMEMLIARSERMSGVGTSRVKPRGWEGMKGAAAKMAASHQISNEVGVGDEDEHDSDDSGWVPDVDEMSDGDKEGNNGNMDNFNANKSLNRLEEEGTGTGTGKGATTRLTALGLAQSASASVGAGAGAGAGRGGHRTRSGSGDSGDSNENNFIQDRLETNTNVSEDRRSKMSYTSAGGTKYSSQGGGRFKPRSATRIIAEERARQEKIFEDTLLEYDDENIGDLEHLYDEEEDEEDEFEDLLDEEREEEEQDDDVEKAALKAEQAILRAQRSIVGTISISELENHPLMEEAMDEFLNAQKDEERVNGIHVIPGAREIHALANYVDPVPFLSIKESVKALERRQKEDEDNLREQMLGDKLINMTDIAQFKTRQLEKEKHDELVDCQHYLQEVREEAEWDCESVLSTYSTLDNHPNLIKEPKNSKYKHHKSRFQIKQEQSIAESDEISAVQGGREALTKLAYQASKEEGGVGRPDKMQPARIVLAGKLSLPEGYGGDSKTRRRKDDGSDDQSVSSRFTIRSNATGQMSVGSAVSGGGTSVRLRMPQSASHSSVSKSHQRSETRFGLSSVSEEQQRPMYASAERGAASTTIPVFGPSRETHLTDEEMEKRSKMLGGDGSGDVGEDDNADVGEEAEDSDEGTSYTQWTRASRKAETAEEKKNRKANAKEEQKIRRLNKKTLRSVYKEENDKLHKADGNKQKTDHISVFKY